MLMSDDEDLIDDIDEEDEVDDSEGSALRVAAGSVDARRKLEAKLEELRLRKMTQDYDF